MLDLLARAEKEAAGGAVGVEQLLNALSQEIRGSAAIVLQAFALGPGSLRPHMSALRNATREVAAASTTAAGQASPFVRDLIARSKDGTYIGREVEVLVEGPSKSEVKRGDSSSATGPVQLTGRTTCDRIVVFNGNPRLAGSLTTVSVEDCTPTTLIGSIVTQQVQHGSSPLLPILM